jgi:predicted pyridoxine 5'-phosphate oxidase superfamily flavin-nucleotide-binding protein
MQDTERGHRFASLAFTPAVRSAQEAMGSRGHYARLEAGEPFNHELGAREAEFIAARDSFYMATVSETGWPYVQHRGGPPGFLRVLDARTLGFADYRGNKQYVTLGNLRDNDRVSLIMVDYPNRQRLKILGHAHMVAADDSPRISKLLAPGQRGRAERGFEIRVAAFDWNCPQHITPRYTQEEMAAVIDPLRRRIVELESLIKKRRASTHQSALTAGCTGMCAPAKSAPGRRTAPAHSVPTRRSARSRSD